jgi:uncharacterized protein YmfQ (DUF2313 family)
MWAARTAFDYLQQFLQLLPRGRIWHRGWGTVQAQDLLLLMSAWVRLDVRAQELLVDAFPCSTLELLPEWEKSLGLPDPCTEQPQTLQQRQAAACAKFTARGGASVNYFVGVAAALGVYVIIDEFTPGDGLGEEWAHTWRVSLSDGGTVVYFRPSVSRVQERLVVSDRSALECLFHLLKPAHTRVIFRYAQSKWDDEASIWDNGLSFWD